MFLWVIIPPARDNRVIGALVLASFAASFISAHTPGLMELSAGTRTIVLTLVIAAVGAAFFPVKDPSADREEDESHAA